MYVSTIKVQGPSQNLKSNPSSKPEVESISQRHKSKARF
jgi:hypothetical protein